MCFSTLFSALLWRGRGEQLGGHWQLAMVSPGVQTAAKGPQSSAEQAQPALPHGPSPVETSHEKVC